MAFTWTSKDAVKGEPISAASVNEVRSLLNTMYNQVNCSTRNAVVYSSDNSSYDTSKDSSIVECTTVYSSRNSSYCTSVNATQTTTSYSGDATGCTNNNGSQYNSNSCDSYNASRWSNDDGSDRTAYNNSTCLGNNSEYKCHKLHDTCTSNYADNYSSHCSSRAGCTSARTYNKAANNLRNWTTDNSSRWSSDDSGNYSSDDSRDYNIAYSEYGCSSQNSSRYGSKAFCPSYNNAKYGSKHSTNRDPYNASVRICSTVHAANGQ